ncbi:hypothetical protein V8C86DRAFT_2794871, partial [Haematococcus lacustris]
MASLAVVGPWTLDLAWTLVMIVWFCTLATELVLEACAFAGIACCPPCNFARQSTTALGRARTCTFVKMLQKRCRESRACLPVAASYPPATATTPTPSMEH